MKRKCVIAPEVLELFPEVQIGVVVAEGINNKPQQATRALIDQEAQFIKNIFAEIAVAEQKNIQAWRRAYTAFGGGSSYRSSVEALVKRVVKDKPLPLINPLVDIYNSISLKYLLPVGGEDLQHIQGDIRLERAEGSETFVALGQTENDPPSKGEVIYVDDNDEVLCRRWNWREAEKTKLTEETTNAILVIDALPPVNNIEVKEATADLAQKVQQLTGARTHLYLLNKNYPQIFIN